MDRREGQKHISWSIRDTRGGGWVGKACDTSIKTVDVTKSKACTRRIGETSARFKKYRASFS